MIESVEELCERRKFSPAERILDALESGQLSIKDQAELSRQLLEYVYPKKRAVEHSGDVGLTLTELLELAEEEWDRRAHENH